MRQAIVLYVMTIFVVWTGEPAGVLTLQAAERPAEGYTLGEVVTVALDRHPSMAGATGMIRQNRGERLAAETYPNPAFRGTVGYGAIRDPSTGVHIVEHTFTLEQPVEWPAKRQARRLAAEAGLAEARAGFEETRLRVIADVKEAFYRLLFAQREAEMAAQNLTMVEEVARTVKTRVQAGEATPFEALKADVEVRKARKDLSRASNALLVGQRTLDLLTNGALGKVFAIQGDFVSLGQNLDPDALAARALERHPTLRRHDKHLEQANHRVVFEREAVVPTVNVVGQYHREAGDESFVGGLSLPLPFWNRRQGEIEMALGARQRAESELALARNELVQAVTQHAQEARTAREQILVFETGLLKQAQQTLDIARYSFQHGAASLLEVLDSQRVYRQSVIEYAQARTDLSIALARLERAVGGEL